MLRIINYQLHLLLMSKYFFFIKLLIIFMIYVFLIENKLIFCMLNSEEELLRTKALNLIAEIEQIEQIQSEGDETKRNQLTFSDIENLRENFHVYEQGARAMKPLRPVEIIDKSEIPLSIESENIKLYQALSEAKKLLGQYITHSNEEESKIQSLGRQLADLDETRPVVRQPFTNEIIKSPKKNISVTQIGCCYCGTCNINEINVTTSLTITASVLGGAAITGIPIAVTSGCNIS